MSEQGAKAEAVEEETGTGVGVYKMEVEGGENAIELREVTARN
jgi:hypothetical protein